MRRTRAAPKLKGVSGPIGAFRFGGEFATCPWWIVKSTTACRIMQVPLGRGKRASCPNVKGKRGPIYSAIWRIGIRFQSRNFTQNWTHDLRIENESPGNNRLLA
ncbi:MAG: hypothetical protein R2932_20475 [Caldilineaceae bacterium]